MAQGPSDSGNQHDRPDQRPTELLGGPAPPPPPPPSPGPPGAPQPPPGYGNRPGYGHPPGPQTEGLATAALVIAIAGFFICPPVGAIVALVLANNARRRIEAAGGRLSGLEQARAARIIAIIELVLTAIVVLVGAIGVVIALQGSTSGQEEGVPHPTPPSVKVGMVQQSDHEAGGRFQHWWHRPSHPGPGVDTDHGVDDDHDAEQRSR
jgi:hypothetical protein